MSNNPFHLRVAARRTAVAAAALAVAAAVAVIVPTAAHAASGRSKSVLAEGVGMHAHPSVRVRALQSALVRHGYSVGRAGIDGRFGPRTRVAVRRVQRRHHLRVDGVVGPKTRTALGLGPAARTATTHRRRSTTSHRAVTPARQTAQPTPAASPPAAVPAPARLGTNRSSSAMLLVVPLVAVIALLFALAFRRQRRRRAARLAAYHLEAVPRPPHEDAPAAAPTPTPQAAPVSPGGLARGALVIGYITEPLATAGNHRRSPESNIESACQRRGWQLVDIARDRANGRILDRPSLSRALERIANGEARGLVIDDARLLSRSADFASFVQWFRDAQAALIALDLGLDTSTPDGARTASALITLNGWAGKWINSRTRRSLADMRPAAPTANPRLAVSERQEVLKRIAELVENGMSAEEVAAQLNDERVPTLFGTEEWWPSSVNAGLRYWRAGSARAADAAPPIERSPTP